MLQLKPMKIENLIPWYSVWIDAVLQIKTYKKTIMLPFVDKNLGHLI